MLVLSRSLILLLPCRMGCQTNRRMASARRSALSRLLWRRSVAYPCESASPAAKLYSPLGACRLFLRSYLAKRCGRPALLLGLLVRLTLEVGDVGDVGRESGDVFGGWGDVTGDSGDARRRCRGGEMRCGNIGSDCVDG
ncbi:hypothetical protein MTO96_047881 [Rhipicephalus appendiculatus]